MNKKIVTIFLVALLFLGGTVCLLAGEPVAGSAANDFRLTEQILTGSDTNPCGGSDRNGGGNSG